MQSKVDLMYFNASWCGPCKMMKPVIENFAKNNSNKINLISIDVDSNSQAAAVYGVNSVPTFIAIKDDNLIDRFSGMVGLDRLNKILN